MQLHHADLLTWTKSVTGYEQEDEGNAAEGHPRELILEESTREGRKFYQKQLR